MSRLNLSADEVLSTTRAVRKRLDLERPVDMNLLLCLGQFKLSSSKLGSNGF